MILIIVESPTKANTIQKFLDSNYHVVSSYGHIRDLPKNELGIDVDNNFLPKYIIPTKARKNFNILKKEAAKTDEVILASDEDREGESIAWHLLQALNLKDPKRIVFHEITKSAIEEALKNPRKVNMDLVDAQQARRILDRIVGYKLSPFLWKKIARGLSAGRVQSVTVKLVVDREKEIEAFKAEEYWSVTARLQKENLPEFEAILVKKNDEAILKLGIKNKAEADDIVKNLNGAEYKIVEIEKKEIKRNSLPPFTTSTLQQEASKKLHFSSKFTMGIAQSLYERGLITYHRTDSLNLSEQALVGARDFITEKYGQDYWPGDFRIYKTKSKGAQEAHEAIRPTQADEEPEILKKKGKIDDKQFRLYDLIWRRFIASQMSQAIFDATKVDIKANNYIFRANGQIVKFNGWLKIYPLKFKEKDLPPLEKEDLLKLLELLSEQHFTQPPPRYNEASLIKMLEEHGIGRPSTYAPVLSTVQQRNYIQKNEQKKFQPTEIGRLVTNLLAEHFPEIVDIEFTAEMEKGLDEIAHDKREWVPVIKDFYDPFIKKLEQKYEEVPKKEAAQEKTDKICPECGAPLIIRMGRFGKFYACTGFPKCRYTATLKKSGPEVKCPKCKEGTLGEKRTRKGKIFYGCSKYPECDFALWDKPTGEVCPECQSLLVNGKKGIKCSNKECHYTKESE
ncbi:MAG: type I DNA topoisomerase [bacterium]